MSTKQKKLVGVEKLEAIGENFSRLRLKFEDNSECYYTGEYYDVLKCMDRVVIFDEVLGVYNKEQVKFANDISVVRKVNVLDASDNPRLYPEDYPKNECSICFEDLEIGEQPHMETVYCTAVEYCSSSRADWRELTLLDNKWRIIKCRQFSPEDRSTNFVGKYIKIFITRSAYGYRTDSAFEVCDYLNDIKNPRIELCKKYVQRIIEEDKDLLDAVDRFDLYKGLDTYKLEEEMELGYEYVRLANELYIAKDLVNVTKACDIQLIVRYLVLSRLYFTKTTEKTIMSPTVMNIVLFQRCKLASNPKLLALMDPMSKENLPERDVVESIKSMSSVIVKADKTYNYSERRKVSALIKRY